MTLPLVVQAFDADTQSEALDKQLEGELFPGAKDQNGFVPAAASRKRKQPPAEAELEEVDAEDAGPEPEEEEQWEEELSDGEEEEEGDADLATFARKQMEGSITRSGRQVKAPPKLHE